jgi:hypothetical protein
MLQLSTMSRFKNAWNRRVTLVLVLFACASALAVAVIVTYQGAGQPDAEASASYDPTDDIDYHLREQRAQGRMGAEFCNPNPLRP